MTDFYVKCDEYYTFVSKVYAVDTVRHEFLVVDSYGNFKWVSTKHCELSSKEEAADYDYD